MENIKKFLNKKIMVLIPHPDDEALGCSGLIHMLPPSAVTLVFITSGGKLSNKDSERDIQIRTQEAEQSAQILRSIPLFLNFPDGEIRNYKNQILNELTLLVDSIQPNIILSPSPIDFHSDHLNTSYLALKLLHNLRTFSLIYYEIYSALRFNILVDITNYWKLKQKSILNYRHSLYNKPEMYVEAMLGLNAHRSLLCSKKGLYEAYYEVNPALTIQNICDHLSYKEFINYE
jgi:N-acetylglucosamine malate deacetylase 1